MFVMLRLLVPLLVVLTVIYIGVSLYSRRVRRNKLEAYWDKKGVTGDREAFVARGLKKYDASFRRKLILGVYVVPLALIAFLVYFSNFM
ncbi:hypothetical protein DS909_11855 [Phaeobacter gallaeciensis]|uniref:Cation/multidrug efflux pump n=2 Tax=Roseobacteraceae TaxID=2854170 RepID=A0A366WVR4_9RHOB|nr:MULTISPECIES: hypothetical protein [Roseobacteraceae]MBT3141152.1 hypothetical protein [Falsiruegeria litorea]MBT8170849.1 hypothetical protein [Falsiruegeria litorea]RBW54522.1 hypothetical protein DS909_11855 [Phaeobacter gallaeciensis]